MEIYSCGTTVKTKINDIKAMIGAIKITFDLIEYQLTYFDANLTMQTIWMHEKEFDIIEFEKQTIGFIKN